MTAVIRLARFVVERSWDDLVEISSGFVTLPIDDLVRLTRTVRG